MFALFFLCFPMFPSFLSLVCHSRLNQFVTRADFCHSCHLTKKLINSDFRNKAYIVKNPFKLCLQNVIGYTAF
jgi:hypothetical protein